MVQQVSNDNLPVIRRNQAVVRKEQAVGQITDSRSRDHPPDRLYSSLSSLAGHMVKSAVYATLDWLSERRASEHSLIERRGETPRIGRDNTRQSLTESSGEIRNRHFGMREGGRFNQGGNFKSQRNRSGARRLRRQKRRWR